ncbi:hypothetical protein GHT06_022751 [Daphnia sinensis]|uniref:alpha-glucosidase n=1 Tax=Daphnia sinensis TaxID=1820382 RepID=A0AAD5KXP6_9CRUS|nr:hypothetical protein GHT06_022751 [Daphnia sinensis]
MMNENYNGVEPQKGQIAPKARTESIESLGSKSESRGSLAQQTEEKAGDLGQVKFTKNTEDSAVEIGAVDVAFAGMGKEELMKYANDPFWKRLRWTLFALFWICWVAMLVIAIVIVVLAPKCPAPAPLEYWQKGVVYSVNPKSFQDSGLNQDGKGDLRGIIGRLNHFVHLGVNMISISPIFATRDDDPPYGHEIVNFLEINPTYGDLQDLKDLTTAAKQEGLKIILDLVINHASTKHPWFMQSAADANGDCGDCFVWHDGKDGGPPNNWLSIFGNTSWTYDPVRKQYYYHVYGPDQPDLNLRSAKVQNELKNITKFWLEQGVSGFRLLSVPYLYEAANMTMNEPQIPGISPGSYASLDHIYTKNLDETYNFVGDLRAVLQEFEDKDGEHRVLFVEAEDTEGASAMKYYGDATKPLADLPVNSKFIRQHAGFTGLGLKNEILTYLGQVSEVQGWPNWVLGNGDTERMASRLGSKLIDAMAMVQLLLPGTPFTYYGDEIGMEDVPLAGGVILSCPTGNKLTADSHCNQARSPYQWDSSSTAGFTNASTPWYPVGSNVGTINAKDQMGATNSYLNIYRELVNLRKQPAIMHGSMSVLNVTTEEIFAFTRIRKGSPGYLVVLNLGEKEAFVDFSKEPTIPTEAQAVIRSSTAVSNSTTRGSKVDTASVPVGESEGLVLSFVPNY